MSLTPKGFAFISLAAVLTAVANLLLRGGVLRYGEFGLTLEKMKEQLVHLGMQPMFVSGVLLYGLAAVVWFKVLSMENLGSSYPALVGLTFMLVAAGAGVFFGETFSWLKIVGILLIFAGIGLVARG